MKSVLIKRRCAAQESIYPAIPVCPRQAVYYVTDEEEPLRRRIEFDYQRCDGCGQCVDLCCGQAIEMNE